MRDDGVAPIALGFPWANAGMFKGIGLGSMVGPIMFRCVLVLSIAAWTSFASAGERPVQVDLTGAWHYHPGDLATPPRVLPAWLPMAVPSNWYRQGLDHAGVVWFVRAVELPREADYAIDFEGVDYQTEVFWDGKRVASHRGYFAPFVADLGRQSGRHVMAVRVDSPAETPAAFSLNKTLIKGVLSHHDTRPGGAWSPKGQDANTGGIWGRVQLRERRAVEIASVRIATVEGSLERAVLDVTLDGRCLSESCRVDYRLLEKGERSVAAGVFGTIGRTAKVLSRELRISSPKLWWPRELGAPDLYDLELTVSGPGGVDRIKKRFGIRTVKEEYGKIVINGEKAFLRGTNYIGSLYLADLSGPALERDLKLMTAVNINAVRVHAHVLPKRFYDLADEMGMLVWQDFPLQWGYEDSPAFRAEAVRQLREMLTHFGNHPSIVFWNGHNEAPWSSDWMVWKYKAWDPDQNRVLDQALADALAEDGTRPFRANSHPAEHAWMGWYTGSIKDFARPTPQSFLTEFGAQAVPGVETLRTFLSPEQLWPLDEKNLAVWEYHNFQIKELQKIAKVSIGGSVAELVANTQNYQARLLQAAAEGLRRQKWQPVGAVFQFMFVEHWPSVNWGVVDYLRRPKAGYAALGRAYQPVLPIAQRKPGREGLVLYVINDRQHPLGSVTIRVKSKTKTQEFKAEVGPDEVVVVTDDALPPAPTEALHLELFDGGGESLAENMYTPGYFQP